MSLSPHYRWVFYSQIVIFVALSALIVLYSAYVYKTYPHALSLALCFYVLPLLIPLRGSLKGNRYTVGYSSLLATWYFLLSSTLFLSESLNRWQSGVLLAAILMALLWFISCLFYNRLTDPKPRTKKTEPMPKVISATVPKSAALALQNTESKPRKIRRLVFMAIGLLMAVLLFILIFPS